mgnify:CR=1 FL=1|tara:strand:+ start:9755 stop:10198 length:444 start_codon:yes stop_codon:yes gene_type:complete
MAVKTYLKEQHKKLESKYQTVARQLEFTYGLIQEKVTSRLHRETTDLEFIRKKLNSLVQQSIVPPTTKRESKPEVSLFKKSSNNKADNSYQENFDWTRGRFSGEVVQIITFKGQIIEKVFLTRKGNTICVKRSELGLLPTLSLIIRR